MWALKFILTCTNFCTCYSIKQLLHMYNCYWYQWQAPRGILAACYNDNIPRYSQPFLHFAIFRNLMEKPCWYFQFLDRRKLFLCAFHGSIRLQYHFQRRLFPSPLSFVQSSSHHRTTRMKRFRRRLLLPVRPTVSHVWCILHISVFCIVILSLHMTMTVTIIL